MKNISKYFLLFGATALMSCGGGDTPQSEGAKTEAPQEVATPTEESAPTSDVPASKRIDLDNKGVGPVKSVTLDPEINQELAKQGEELYSQLCTACHKTDKKFIGPAPKDILERRSPEWVMNMILNPLEMVQQDPLAKDLLQEFNGSPMSNQGLTEEQARSILEYFRTL